MDKEEFSKKMKELGWKDEYIEECLKDHEDAKKNGIYLPLEINLVKAPIQY